jgi:membrane protein implicated in regulation of membrane protease activity
MTMSGLSVARALFFGLGALLVILGFGAITIGGEVAIGGLWLVLMGGFLMVVAVLERTRYRSAEAESSNEPAGLGGGETGPVEPRFRPTEEVFLDPTTGRRMRVLVDPRTGERRYVAEA